MHRLLFEKTGRAVWISHLDLMRLFQRAFKRAGLKLTHTQGFNPRPSVSIALPLSVGVSSRCELLDFELEDQVDCSALPELLNDKLVEGVRVLEAYDGGAKIRDLAYLHCNVELQYDRGVPAGAAQKLHELFAGQQLIVEKKTKSGLQDQDLIPMIRQICVCEAGEKALVLDAVVCCQNPTLNPSQLVRAIEVYAPAYIPDHSICSRLEIFNKNNEIFR